jgi:hypothetical protein
MGESRQRGKEKTVSRKTITAVAALAVAALAIPAMAAPSIDTVLTQGYDPESARLIFGVNDIDEECGFADGELGYSIEEDGSVAFSGEIADEPEADEEDKCSLTSVDVTGPNGQVNHGQVVSSFVHALKAMGLNGNGCLIRIIAQSDYGQGDQQVTVADAEPVVAPSDGTVGIQNIETACGNGASDGDNGELDDTGHEDRSGRPDHAGKPEKADKPETSEKAETSNGNRGNGNGNDRSNGRGNGKP